MDVMKPAMWITGGLALLTLGAVAFFTRHSFNITDEGWYLLSAAHPKEYTTWPSSSFHLTGVLFQAVHFDIVLFRLAGLLLLAAAAALLGHAVYRIILRAGLSGRHPGIALFCMAATVQGALVYYTWVLYTPSYNWINAVLITLMAALAVYTYERHLENPVCRTLTWLTAGSGACVTLAFFNKFPTGTILAAVYLGWLCRLARPRHGAVFLLAGMATAGLYFLFIQPLPEWQTTFAQGRTAANLMAHDPAKLLRMYVRSLPKNLLPAPLVAVLGIGTAAAFAMRGRSGTRFPAIWRWLPFLLGACLAVQLLLHKYEQGGRHQILHLEQFYCLLVLMFAAFLAVTRHLAVRRLWPILALLTLLPWTAALGTNNPLSAQVLFYMSPVFAALIILIFIARAASPANPFPAIGLLCLSFFAASQTVSAPFIAPYEINGTWDQQTEPTAVGTPPSTLKLDMPTHRFLGEMQAIAKKAGFSPGDDILAFDDAPGLVFALGGVSPATAWWFGSWLPTRTAFNEFCLRFIPPQRLRRAFILQTVPDGEIAPFTKAIGRFPEDYTLAGEAVWPLSGRSIKFWIPPGRPAPH